MDYTWEQNGERITNNREEGCLNHVKWRPWQCTLCKCLCVRVCVYTWILWCGVYMLAKEPLGTFILYKNKCFLHHLLFALTVSCELWLSGTALTSSENICHTLSHTKTNGFKVVSTLWAHWFLFYYLFLNLIFTLAKSRQTWF